VAALFEERDRRDVVIVDYSMGSIVALRYLTRLWHARASHARICRPDDAVPDEDRTILTPFRSPGAMAKDFAKSLAENERPFLMPARIPESRSCSTYRWLAGGRSPQQMRPNWPGIGRSFSTATTMPARRCRLRG
jgi:hypothetical protein